MPDPRFLRLQALFEQAVGLDEHDWTAFAAREAADDVELQQQLLRLLRRERRAWMLTDQAIDDGLAATLRRALPGVLPDGAMIGPYRVDGLLGHGGMGRVYRATRCDGTVEQQVAIKQVRGDRLQPGLLRRFSAEQQALAALSHPGICRFLDAGRLDDGSPYVVMELVEGEPLLDWCDARRLGLDARLRLFRKVLAAVDHAHRNLIVHRDIKSANVMVDASGEPKLLDFGIAKALGPAGAQSDTVTAERYFTPANAAPEQLRGDPVTVACDVYALGLLGYELLVGGPAYELAGLRAAEIERCLLQVPPPLASQRALAIDPATAAARGLPSPLALARRLSGDLDTLLAKCLRKSPEERYASVEQLDAELGRLLAGHPIRARGNDRMYRLRKFVARHRLPVGLAAASVLLLSLALAALLRQTVVVGEQRNRALAERDRAQQAVELLKTAFLGADPARAVGADVRVRDVLEAARPQLAALQSTQPQLYASLAGTLAEVELALGLDQRAGDLADAAAEAAGRAGEPKAVQQHLHALAALAHAGAGRHSQATQALRAAAGSGHGTANGGDDELALQALARGRMALQQGDYPAAIDASRRAIELLAALPWSDEWSLRARWQLADALRLDGQVDRSLAQLTAIRSQLGRELPAGHPAIMRTRLRLAETLRKGGDAAASIAEAGGLPAEIERLYGARSTSAGLAHAVLALAHRDAGDETRAIDHHRQALAAWEEVLGPLHTNTLRSRFNLAEALATQPGGRAEAEQLYRDAVAGAERAQGDGSNAAVYFRLRLAALQVADRRPQEALQTLRPEVLAGRLDELVAANRNDYLAVLADARAALGCSEPPVGVACAGSAP